MVWLKSQTYDLYTVFLYNEVGNSASDTPHHLQFPRHVSTGEPNNELCERSSPKRKTCVQGGAHFWYRRPVLQVALESSRDAAHTWSVTQASQLAPSHPA